jgi:hypothetical protein
MKADGTGGDDSVARIGKRRNSCILAERNTVKEKCCAMEIIIVSC